VVCVCVVDRAVGVAATTGFAAVVAGACIVVACVVMGAGVVVSSDDSVVAGIAVADVVVGVTATGWSTTGVAVGLLDDCSAAAVTM
jgi:hypothetical protein